MFAVLLLLTGYCLVAALLIALGVKLSRPGAVRVFVFATLFSLFFSVGLIPAHGVLPAPGMVMLVTCLATGCSQLFANTQEMLLMTIVPMLSQWVVVLVISYLVWGGLRAAGRNRART